MEARGRQGRPTQRRPHSPGFQSALALPGGCLGPRECKIPVKKPFRGTWHGAVLPAGCSWPNPISGGAGATNTEKSLLPNTQPKDTEGVTGIERRHAGGPPCGSRAWQEGAAPHCRLAPSPAVLRIPPPPGAARPPAAPRRSPTFTPSPRSAGLVHIKNPHLEAMDEDVLYHLDLGTKTHDLPAMFGDVKVTGRGRSRAAARSALVPRCCRPILRPPGRVRSCRRAAALQPRAGPFRHLESSFSVNVVKMCPFSPCFCGLCVISSAL